MILGNIIRSEHSHKQSHKHSGSHSFQGANECIRALIFMKGLAPACFATNERAIDCGPEHGASAYARSIFVFALKGVFFFGFAFARSF